MFIIGRKLTKLQKKLNIQNQTISELLYTDDKKSKYSSNPNDTLKSAESFCEKFYTKEATSKTAIPELFSTISNRNKISNKRARQKVFQRQ